MNETLSMNGASVNEISNICVSYFKTVHDKVPQEKSLQDIFSLISNGRLEREIQAVRNAKTKDEKDKLKILLPSITVSGIFRNGHSSKDFIRHSGLIQIDFDSISHPEDFKKILCMDVFTHACFISPSGNGVKVLAKIFPEKHIESFEGLLQYYFDKYKQKIDGKCKDIGRLMFLSHDKNLFVNPYSMTFNKITSDIENTLIKIESKKIDITKDYDSWLKIGFAFADQFKESGRTFFHRVSKFHSDYSEKNCNEQFDKCLKSGKQGITVKTFFQLAKEAGVGIRPESNRKPEIKSSGSNKTVTSKFLMVENYLGREFDFRYNEVSNEIEIKKKSEKDFTPVNENNIYRHLQHRNINFSLNNIASMLRSDFVPVYNPIKNYFEDLPEWDGKTDHISALHHYITAKDQERFNRHFKKMFIRSVACALGYAFNKHVFILLGGQSSGKTTFCRWLCPDKLKSYYAENISTDKDSLISLTENFIINLDELATMQRVEINALKSMLTKDAVKIRKPYDKKPSISKRRANFFGSTNKEEILTDETGSVRWLCFEILKIEWSYKDHIEIDSIWAQAFSLLKSGFKFELTAEEIAENEKVNAIHHIRTLEMDLIQRFFEPATKETASAIFKTTSEVIEHIKTNSSAALQLNSIAVGKALRQLGFMQVTLRRNLFDYPIKGYYMKSASSPTIPTTNS